MAVDSHGGMVGARKDGGWEEGSKRIGNKGREGGRGGEGMREGRNDGGRGGE